MRQARSQSSDQEIIRQVLAGETQIYSILVDRYLKDVYALAMRILNNSADAEDVSQDAFLRALQKLATYNADHSYRNWLLKITGNLAINRIRSRGREHRLHLKLAAGDREDDASVSDGREVPQAREWAYWLDQIDEMQRSAIVLFHFHELPYTEIAEVLGVPVNTVRTYLYRGRKRLRDLMSQQSPSETAAWNVAM